jgi:hypothetical protein
MVELAQTMARWDAFLAKICERADETLAQAEEGCAMLLDVNGLDPQPMTVAWMAIENQLHELAQKIEQTWSEKVEPALEEDPQLEGQRAKGDAARASIAQKKEQLEVRMFADAARRIYEQARVNLAKEHKCAQCGAALELRAAFFRSHHVTCGFCRNVNTFVPGSTIAAVESFCCHHLAREKSAPLWAAWTKAQLRKDSDRASAQKALRDYTTAYLRARIELVPEYAQDFEKDLKGKMAFFDDEG